MAKESSSATLAARELMTVASSPENDTAHDERAPSLLPLSSVEICEHCVKAVESYYLKHCSRVYCEDMETLLPQKFYCIVLLCHALSIEITTCVGLT